VKKTIASASRAGRHQRLWAAALVDERYPTHLYAVAARLAGAHGNIAALSVVVVAAYPTHVWIVFKQPQLKRVTLGQTPVAAWFTRDRQSTEPVALRQVSILYFQSFQSCLGRAQLLF
jgi:hypothetical protein